jgi:serine/threonine protein kinase
MLDYIVAHGSLKESQARKFCRGIGSALEYCHSNNIVHRDLKIENIMINNAGEIKIIDFGLSNLYTHDHLLKTYCGSLYFAAPELLSAHPYRGPEVDIWSFGVVLFVLVCGRVPFDDKSVSNLHEKIKKGHIDYPEHLSPDCISLMKRMLVVDVTKRASIQDVLNHRWINKGYSGPVSNYIPIRTPLTMPFSRSVITEIVNLNLASSEEQVANDLTEIVHSEYYLRCSENWRLKTSGLKYDPTLLDPTRGYHPLVSIYFLVDEMLERKRAKFERNAITEAKQVGNTSNVNPLYTTPHVQQNPVFNAASQHPNMAHEPQNRIVTQPVPQQYQHGGFPETSNREVFPGPPKLNIEVPTAPYSLPFPEAAHTSPRNDVSNRSFNKMTGTNAAKQLSPPPFQQQSPVEENGVNALLRKLSTKKQPSKDDVRRIGSMKVTTKEKQQQQQQQQQQQIHPLHSNSSSLRKKSPHHQRAASAYTPTIFNPDNDKLQTLRNEPTVATTRKFHPSARANSVGHSRKHSLNISKTGTYTVDANAPPLPQLENTADFGGFFDDEMDNITFEDNKPKKLTDKEIIAQFEKAPPNSMPSIEYPKTLFLKGFFSVQTTSTKPLPIIRYDIITVLPQLGVQFVEVKGGFICVHYPSIVDTPKRQVNRSTVSTSHDDNALGSPTRSTRNRLEEVGESEQYLDTVEGLKTPTISESSSQRSRPEKSRADDASRTSDSLEKNTSSNNNVLLTPKNGHRRKFSLGNGILGSKKGEKLTLSTSMNYNSSGNNYNNEVHIPTTPAPANLLRSSTDESSESLALDETNGASDMLVSSRLEQQNMGHSRTPSMASAHGSETHGAMERSSKTPLKFEIHIVKVPLVGLYGIQFKKVSGNTWLYKSLASEILSRLNL